MPYLFSGVGSTTTNGTSSRSRLPARFSVGFAAQPPISLMPSNPTTFWKGVSHVADEDLFVLVHALNEEALVKFLNTNSNLFSGLVWRNSSSATAASNLIEEKLIGVVEIHAKVR